MQGAPLPNSGLFAQVAISTFRAIWCGFKRSDPLHVAEAERCRRPKLHEPWIYRPGLEIPRSNKYGQWSPFDTQNYSVKEKQ